MLLVVASLPLHVTLWAHEAVEIFTNVLNCWSEYKQYMYRTCKVRICEEKRCNFLQDIKG